MKQTYPIGRKIIRQAETAITQLQIGQTSLGHRIIICIFTKQEGRLMQFSNTLIYLQDRN